MVRIWDFLMRRKSLLFGFLLIFVVSAAFSSVYLRPNIAREPVNVPDSAYTTEVVTPAPEPEPIPESEPDNVTYLATVAPDPEDVVTLSTSISVPNTNFNFTLPGNIINLASLSRVVAANRQLEQADAVKTWHYIVSTTTAALIIGGVMVCLARFLSKNMLQ